MLWRWKRQTWSVRFNNAEMNQGWRSHISHCLCIIILGLGLGFWEIIACCCHDGQSICLLHNAWRKTREMAQSHGWDPVVIVRVCSHSHDEQRGFSCALPALIANRPVDRQAEWSVSGSLFKGSARAHVFLLCLFFSSWPPLFLFVFASCVPFFTSQRRLVYRAIWCVPCSVSFHTKLVTF